MLRVALTACETLPDYEMSIRRGGAEPLVVSAGDPAAILRECHGLVLSGGGDVDPTLYGEAPHPSYQPADAGRDAFEQALIREATRRDRPILAICRGLQILNVTRGGSLWQDVETMIPHSLPHRPHARYPDPRSTRPDAIAHSLQIATGSALAELLGTRGAEVNSRHHQSVKVVGTGLVVSAWSADRVVEAVEDPTMRFCLGVQWHPENFWRTGEFRTLFDGFVRAVDLSERTGR